MKLRISKQSLRFRLNLQDIEDLALKKTLKDQIHLTAQTLWGYDITLVPILDTKVISTGSHLQVQVPEENFIAWLRGKENEWNYQQQEPALNISIEKDLKPHHT